MIKKIQNPFINVRDYNCFGCDPSNNHGLHLKFYYNETTQVLHAEWKPQPHFEGYPGVIHGGIQATLLDEISSWYVYSQLNTAGVTQSLNVDYKTPVPSHKGPLLLSAHLKKMQKRIAIIYTSISLCNQEEILTEGIYHFATFPPKMAKERFLYPGQEAFYAE